MSDVVVHESAIEGLGVFAARTIRRGEMIRRFNLVREISEDSPLRPDYGERLEHCTYPDDKMFLVGPPDRRFNHSCDPNAYKRFTGYDIYAFARRDIETGAEITLDYLINNSGGKRWACNCDSPRCRGELVSGFFDLPRSIQLEILPLLAPWFIRKHRREVEELQRCCTSGHS